MQSLQPIVLLVVSDNLYLKHTAVMVASACKAAAPRPIDLYFMAQGASEQNVAIFSKVVRKYVSSFNLIEEKDQSVREPSAGYAHVSTAAFGKIKIIAGLPEHVHRAIYLDGDMVVLGDLQSLMEVDLKGNVIAAVENPGYSGWDRSGISRESGYFNSGLMVIDVARWKADGCTDRVFECLRELEGKRTTADQEALNLAFNKAWTRLDDSWNYQTHIRPTDATVADVQADARIIHYTGSPKPWHYPKPTRAADSFYRRASKEVNFPHPRIGHYPLEDNLIRWRRLFKK